METDPKNLKGPTPQTKIEAYPGSYEEIMKARWKNLETATSRQELFRNMPLYPTRADLRYGKDTYNEQDIFLAMITKAGTWTQVKGLENLLFRIYGTIEDLPRILNCREIERLMEQGLRDGWLMVLDEAKYREFVESIRKPFLPNYEIREDQEPPKKKYADNFNTVIDGLTGLEYSLEEIVKLSEKRRAEQQQTQQEAQEAQEKLSTPKEEDSISSSEPIYDRRLLPLNERDEKGLLS